MKFNCTYKIVGPVSCLDVESECGKFKSSCHFDRHLSGKEIAEKSISAIEEMEKIINILLK